VAAVHQGKQQWEASREDRSRPARPRGAGAGAVVRRAGERGLHRGAERVFSALTDAQRAHGGEGVYLDEVARASGLDRERTRVLLHDLTAVHHLVTELQRTDAPDLGPRFEVKLRQQQPVPGEPEVAPAMFDRATM
jgi:hypothetical protein